MNKTDKVLELLREYLSEDNTCAECIEIFQNYGITIKHDFVSCKNCPASSSNESCLRQKQVNLIRMTKLLRKMK